MAKRSSANTPGPEERSGDEASPSKSPSQPTRLAISDQQLLSHNHGLVHTSDAMRFLFGSWTEEQAQKNSGELSSGDGIGAALEKVRKFLSVAGSTDWNQWVVGHINYAADRQVARTFSTSQAQYERACEQNQLKLDEEKLTGLAGELKSWAQEDGTAMLGFWLDEESRQILAQCPNPYFFWHLLHNVSFHGFPVSAYSMKQALVTVRNEFLWKCYATFGRLLPLTELHHLCQLRGLQDSQTDTLLKTLSVAELAFCIKEGGLCMKGPGEDPKKEPPHLVFNQLFLVSTSSD